MVAGPGRVRRPAVRGERAGGGGRDVPRRPTLRRRTVRRRLPGGGVDRVAGDRPPGPVVAVVGPTATGKSDLGLALAEALDGEVINADSMQLYRGMDVGTAKLP